MSRFEYTASRLMAPPAEARRAVGRGPGSVPQLPLSRTVVDAGRDENAALRMAAPGRTPTIAVSVRSVGPTVAPHPTKSTPLAFTTVRRSFVALIQTACQALAGASGVSSAAATQLVGSCWPAR